MQSINFVAGHGISVPFFELSPPLLETTFMCEPHF